MDRPITTTISLCSGVGWLDEGVRAGLDWLGFHHQPLAYCERDAYAAAVLLSRMEDETLEPCPIWCGDLRDFDATPFRGLVDVLAAGLPCQPYSVAGKQLGNDDHRSHGDDGAGPIPQFLRIVAECRPAVVFLENVPPWVRKGWFRPVGEALCGLGYTLESPLFVTAQSVGASHRRERVFVLAHRPQSRGGRLPEPNRWNDSADVVRSGCGVESGCAGNRSGDGIDVSAESRVVGHSQRSRTDAQPESSGPRGADSKSGESVADTLRRDGQPRAGRERVLDDGSELGLFAPGPSGNWHNIPTHLWPAIKSGVRVLVDGRAELVVDESRADQLRCGGNGCVPLAAAVAFVELMRRIA